MFGSNPFAKTSFASAGGPQNITGTLSVTLDDVSANASGVVVHTGSLSLTTDSIIFAATGAEQHTGTLNVTLDDVIVAMSGIDAHNGYLTLTLDDAEFSASGSIEHTGTLALVLDDVVIHMSGSGAETGTLSLTTDNVVVAFSGEVIPHNIQLTHGGYPKKKKRKNQNAEIEKTIRKIIDGEPADEEVAEAKPEQPKPVIQIEDKSPEFKAQIDQILSQLNAIELAELDDEETLLMLL